MPPTATFSALSRASDLGQCRKYLCFSKGSDGSIPFKRQLCKPQGIACGGRPQLFHADLGWTTKFSRAEHCYHTVNTSFFNLGAKVCERRD